MEIDDGMVLNLVPYVFKPKKHKNNNNNNNSNKDSAEHHKQKEEYSKTVADESENTRKEKHLNKDGRSHKSSSSQKTLGQRKYIDPKDFVPVSNLFNKNPVIPLISGSDSGVEKTKEVLFSSDSVDNMNIGDKLKSNLKNHMKFSTLTEIQKLSIPLLLNGQDLMIKSPTGSGKTLCYSIPIMDRLSKATPAITRSDGPKILVLVPTRELALQTLGVFQDLCKCCISVVPGILIGGEKCKSEKARLRKGVNILIATPGRLIYHLTETSCLDLSKLEYLVMDEADHLLELGNREKIDKILEMVGKNDSIKRQSILLSATLNSNVKDLVSVSLRDPVFIDSASASASASASSDENSRGIQKDDNTGESIAEDFVTPGTLTQYFITVPAKLRLICLMVFTITKILPPKKAKIILFTSSKNSVSFLYDAFKIAVCDFECCEDYKAFMLHGDLTQQQRFEMFDKFKRCDSGLLICTDVASRGLDIKKVDWVIQYSCPTQSDDYLHRVGRTARIGETGSSVLFLLPSEVEYIKLLNKSSVVLSEIKVGNVLKKIAEGKGSKIVEQKAQSLQNKIEESVSGSKELYEKAIGAYKTYIQSYATYPKSMKNIFHIKLLHLGHVAKSFGLRKAPVNAIASVQISSGEKRKAKITQKESVKRRKVDEFGEVVCGPRTKKETTKIKKKKKPKSFSM